MKKHFTTFLLLASLLAFKSQGQTVPNGDMEVWNDLLVYKEPSGWSTPNALTFAFFNTVTQSSDALDGASAARLECFFLAAFNINVPGAMGTGTLDATSLTFTGGFPLGGSVPASVIGYYKYFPSGSDTCLVYSILTHWDAVNSKRDTVAITAFMSGDTTDAYTLFQAPYFTIMPGTTPDSALILVSTASDIAAAQVGSVMFIDDIGFSNAVGVSEPVAQSLSLFPSPADVSVELNLPEGIDAKNIIITNTAGSLVTQMNVTSGKMKINTKSFAPGIYVCFVNNNEGKAVATGKFSVKH